MKNARIPRKTTVTAKADLQLKRARRAMSEGRREDAQAACVEALKRVPDCADAYYLLGRIALDAEARSQAVRSPRKSPPVRALLPQAAHMAGFDLFDGLSARAGAGGGRTGHQIEPARGGRPSGNRHRSQPADGGSTGA